MGFSQRNDAHKGKRVIATPAPISLTLPTEAHPIQMQSEENAPPQVQNSTPPSLSVDVESHQAFLVGSNTRSLTATDAPTRTHLITPMLNLATPTPTVSSNTPSVDPRTQVLVSLSSPNIPHPANYQPNRNFSSGSTTVFAASATHNRPAVPPSSQKPKPPPTCAFTSPHNGESPSLPIPSSETFTGLFSAPSMNASHLRVAQSGTGIATSGEIYPLAGPNWDRNAAARPEIRQFSGSKADCPLLPKKDEITVTIISSFFNKY
jgi:hypothetical protein